MTDFNALVIDYVAEAKRGEDYHLASGGYRSNGFRITLRALETVNQAILARMPDVVDDAALAYWGAGLPEHPLYQSVVDLQGMGTPFAAHVWKLLVTLIHRESQVGPTPT